MSPVDTPYVDKANWVVNLSSRFLSDAEKALLKKGLNFAVTPANIPATEIIAKVEAAARQLDTEQADTVRRVVNGILIANLYMESFEEQAITTSSYEPRIWKRHVDDTFTILDRENVDDFLQHLNNQQPSIRFTMETEKDNKLAFLDTAVLREPDGRLTTSVYRKPTRTDQYLAYDSHQPQSVKRGIVKCLYERAKCLVTKPSVISEEKKYLSSVLVSNGYPFSFLQKLTKTGKPNNSAEPTDEFKATAVLPYVAIYITRDYIVKHTKILVFIVIYHDE